MWLITAPRRTLPARLQRTFAANKWRLATGAEIDYELTVASDADIFTGLDVDDQFVIELSLYRTTSGGGPRGTALDLYATTTPGTEHVPLARHFHSGRL